VSRLIIWCTDYLTTSSSDQRNTIGYGSGGGGDTRTLKQVERDIADAGANKEKAYTEISRLNDEQRRINEQISRV
jgi:hypothetical protein